MRRTSVLSDFIDGAEEGGLAGRARISKPRRLTLAIWVPHPHPGARTLALLSVRIGVLGGR